jgi:hypothetical protein
MNNSHRAMISWISAEDGGRMQPPPGPKYIGVVQFEEDPSEPFGAWSLAVNFERRFSGGKVILAQVQFLVDEAPDQLLHSGSRFALFEGRKRVAKGVVLPATVQVPDEVNDFESALIG